MWQVLISSEIHVYFQRCRAISGLTVLIQVTRLYSSSIKHALSPVHLLIPWAWMQEQMANQRLCGCDHRGFHFILEFLIRSVELDYPSVCQLSDVSVLYMILFYGYLLFYSGTWQRVDFVSRVVLNWGFVSCSNLSYGNSCIVYWDYWWTKHGGCRGN